MALSCLIGFHQWNGCICSKCQRSRDEGHDWSKDCEKCSQCGATRQNVHQWDGCKCSKCGKTRDEGHDWSNNNGKCSKCGKNQITFEREEHPTLPPPYPTITTTKRIYSAPSREAALSFLSKQNVTEPFFYIEIDTPKGRFGIDNVGKIYDSQGHFIETDEQVIKTNKDNLSTIDLKTDHQIIINSLKNDYEEIINLNNIKKAEISSWREKLYIDLTWNISDDPSIEEFKSLDGDGIKFVYNIIFTDNISNIKKFQCNSIIVGRAYGIAAKYTFNIIDKIIELS